MSLISRVKSKLYYKYATWFSGGNTLVFPEELGAKKNIFIYFDYEREFGGHNTSISDKNILTLLNLLDNYKIKATWFTVGRNFNKYPMSIKAVLKRGHEIGSHTYNHVAPYNISRNKLKQDFSLFEQASKYFCKVKGFHSPNGKWNLSLLQLLAKNNYSYDVIGEKFLRKGVIAIKGKNSILRLPTIGDDWSLYSKNKSQAEVYCHFADLYKSIGTGEVGGIGAHPWVLFSNPNIFEGYKQFLEFISQSNGTNINTAQHFVDLFKKVIHSNLID
ncbi:MAG: polysaccharide deacetylase family protein [bacterium]